MLNKSRFIAISGLISSILMMEIIIRLATGEGIIFVLQGMNLGELFILGVGLLFFWLCSSVLISMLFYRRKIIHQREEKGISWNANLSKFEHLKPRLGLEALERSEIDDNKVKYEAALEVLMSANISKDYAKSMLEHRGDYISVSKIKEMLRDPEKALPGGALLTKTSKMECPRCESYNIEVMGEKKSNFSTGKAVAGRALVGKTGTLAGFAGSSQGYESFCRDCRHRFIITK